MDKKLASAHETETDGSLPHLRKTRASHTLPTVRERAHHGRGNRQTQKELGK